VTSSGVSFCLPILALGIALGCVPTERPEGDSQKHKARRAVTESVRQTVDIPDPNDKPVPAPDAAPPSTRTAKKPKQADESDKAGAEEKAANDGAQDPMLTEVFADSFDRAELGDAWLTTSPGWRIEDGRLCVQNARNHPLWLKRRLPKNARVEFVVTPHSEDGDIKVEIWGDGRSAATTTSYRNASSYIAIFGGWKNQFHVLARLDEHAPNRPEIKLDPGAAELRARPVQAEEEYSFKIERDDGKAIRWLVDDIEIFNFNDPAPLAGEGHDHFAFNNWQVRSCFDKLKITPLGE
jgi:hypothetical protein